MAELVPIPFATLLRRARAEWARRRAVFDLPERRFHRQAADLDLSVTYGGARASNPVGPAAGPHTQLAQNIALGWLGGARVFELKTVQINDRLTLSRPCIDMATIGYNTEWSQELRLEESLREYVKASMLIEALDAMGILGQPGGDVLFDISVGYDLEGLRSPRVVQWLERLRDARPLVESLRAEIPRDVPGVRDLPFRTAISNTVTLSTFHGTPPGEIERIVEFLAGELGFHTIVKMNPPMLGRERLEHLLHDVLGYRDVEVHVGCYDRALTFDDAVAMVRRLRAVAARSGVDIGVKCGNTLEVVNRGAFLKEPVQYLSGQPLHALHAALALQWREAFGDDLTISFSAGVDAQNVADCVAAGLMPVTTCTDLLRTGGYGRLSRYFVNLEGRMREAGARSIPDLIARTAAVREMGAAPFSGNVPEKGAAPISPVLRNARRLLERAVEDPRYRAEANRKPPRKLGTHLWLWDCLSCSKCIPVCPNDAIFEIDVEPFVGEVPVLEVGPNGWRETAQTLYRALKATQIALVADACNACGNCDVFCPEDGGPHVEKPRFFLSEESWQRSAPLTGFLVERDGTRVTIRGRFAESGECSLTRDAGTADDAFASGAVEVRLDRAPLPLRVASARLARRSGESRIPITVSLAPAATLRLLLDALQRADRVNFVSVTLLETP